MHDDTGPYARAHQAYAAAGWRGVLPVGRAPARKNPPPLGWTGHAAGNTWPSGADRQAWADGPEGGRNIALRLPADVIGLDVDAYGAKVGGATLAGLVAQYGPLPPTWVTSARDDGVSGIRLYRVPPGLNWPGEAGDNIEVVQVGHRYALVWPSINPDADGAVYRWWIEDEFGQRSTAAEILGSEGELPRVGELPELPTAWVAGLSLPYGRVDPTQLEDSAVREWLTACRQGDACEPVSRVTREACQALIEGRARSRHELTRDAVRAIAAYGGEGHVGAWQVLTQLRDAFLTSIEGDVGRDGAGEWARLLTGGVRLAAAASPEPRQACDCALRNGEGVMFDPPHGGGIAGPDVMPPELPAAPPVDEVALAVEALRARMLPVSELHRLPKPEPLIRGLLNLNTDTWLIGASGSGKSFVALDWACHVATGRRWHGAEVARGRVLYVVAEGATGIRQRVDAWVKDREAVSDDLVVLPVAVQALSKSAGALDMTVQWRALCAIVAQFDPALIVLDTQARMSLAARENDNTEMGLWVEAVSRLRSQCGACVLVVHHTGRNGGDARGASAIDGAQDAEWKVERVGPREEMRARLRLDKAKDARDGIEHALTLRVVELGHTDHGEPVSSLVVDMQPFGSVPARIEPDHAANLGPNRLEALVALREVALPDGDTQADLLRKINELRAERAEKAGHKGKFKTMPKSSLTTALTRKDGTGLVELGLVVRVGTSKFADKERYEQWAKDNLE
jgi:hypothetical protein